MLTSVTPSSLFRDFSNFKMSFAHFCTKWKWITQVLLAPGFLGSTLSWYQLLSIRVVHSFPLYRWGNEGEGASTSKISQWLLSTALESLPYATTGPLCGATSISFSWLPYRTTFPFEKTTFTPCPFLKKKKEKRERKEKTLPHSRLQNKILFISPAPSFLRSQYKKTLRQLRNYHWEKSHLFWAIHLRLHTGAVFNTPEQSTSG